MNVDKVSVNNQRAYLTINPPNIKRNPSFNGNAAIIANLEEEINKNNTPVLRVVNKFRDNIGELQEICINALGTGLLAPIFIKYNPLSKTDEDTRTYTAMRQPVSAVLAVATQGVITIPVVKLIKKLANDGYFGIDCNLTPFPNKKDVEAGMKKLHPHASKAEINKLVEQHMDEAMKPLIESLRNNNTISYTEKDLLHPKNEGKQVQLSKEKVTDVLNRIVEDMVKDEKDQLTRCQGEKTQKRLARCQFYRTNSEDAQKLLNEMRTTINNSNDEKSIVKALKAKRKGLKSSPQLLEMLQETIDYVRAGDKDIGLEKITKMQGWLDVYKKLSEADVKNKVTESLKDRIDSHQNALKFLDKVKDAIKKGTSIKDIETMFNEEKKTETSRFAIKETDFVKEVVNKLKSLTEKHVSGVNRIASLVAALAILPVSCWLLNWIYPRFMDAVFPNLSNKKHGNESKELVDKATKNSEVK